MIGRYWIDPFGCAKNQVDAENLESLLRARGLSPSDGPEGADYILVNSCGFIESAKRESIDAVLGHRRDYPGAKIILAGCLAQRYGQELGAELKEADAIFGNGDLSRLDQLLDDLDAKGRAKLLPERVRPMSGRGRQQFYSGPGSAYLKISEGCSNRCSFCAIPLIRGPLSSREIRDIALEATSLEERGIREIVIIGQDLASFGLDRGQPGLVELLEACLASTRSADFRLLYIHPDRFPTGLLSLAAKEPRLLPYFDIPFQHASAPLLKAMNRNGSAPAYLELISSIRHSLPDAALRSTFLLGFPGETEADQGALLSFIEAAKLDWAGFFCYSREDGTVAAGLKGRVAKRLAERRMAEAQEAQTLQSEARLDARVGKEFRVLVEESLPPAPGEEGHTLALGRSFFQAPEVDGLCVLSPADDLVPGQSALVRALSRSGLDLRCRVLPKES